MADFATADELATFLGETFDSDQEARATLLLGLASANIRATVGQTLDSTTSTATLEVPWDARRVVLPERPATDVASVAVGGNLLSETSWEWEGGQVIHLSFGAGYPVANGPDVYPETTFIEVTYTHGLTGDDLVFVKGLALNIASRAYTVPAGGVRQHSESLGSFSESFTYADSSGGCDLTADEERTLRRRFTRRSHAIPF